MSIYLSLCLQWWPWEGHSLVSCFSASVLKGSWQQNENSIWSLWLIPVDRLICCLHLDGLASPILSDLLNTWKGDHQGSLEVLCRLWQDTSVRLLPCISYGVTISSLQIRSAFHLAKSFLKLIFITTTSRRVDRSILPCHSIVGFIIV